MDSSVGKAKIMTIRPFGESKAKPSPGSTDNAGIIGRSPTQLCCWLSAAWLVCRLADANMPKLAKNRLANNNLLTRHLKKPLAYCRGCTVLITVLITFLAIVFGVDMSVMPLPVLMSTLGDVMRMPHYRMIISPLATRTIET